MEYLRERSILEKNIPRNEIDETLPAKMAMIILESNILSITVISYKKYQRIKY